MEKEGNKSRRPLSTEPRDDETEQTKHKLCWKKKSIRVIFQLIMSDDM